VNTEEESSSLSKTLSTVAGTTQYNWTWTVGIRN